MKTAIIIHGWIHKQEYFDSNISSPSNSHWLPWIQKQLLLKNIVAQTPEMPDGYGPNYEKWKWMFEQFTLDKDTILIGHSCGGGFLVRWLSENNIKVGKVILVAPWINPENYSDTDLDKNFFKFDLDQNLVSKTDGLITMYSNDDSPDVIETVNVLKSKIKGAVFQQFTGKGHFTLGSMKTEKFPELLENIIN